MGSVNVTRTECIPIGKDAFLSEGIHFESYEDFINYENRATIQAESQHTVENKNNLYLTADEIYMLRVLLGHVADKECSSVAEKLEALDPSELDVEDYDKLYIEVFIDEDKHVLKDSSKDLAIKFKK